MSALTLERLTKFAGVVPARGTFPIRANTQVFKGSIVAIDSAGRALPAGAISTGALSAVGKASATYDNRTGSVLGGAAGAVDVEVEFGTFGWLSATGGDAIAAKDVGKAAYMVDDQTVGLTSSASARGVAGIITEIRDGQVFVFQGPHVAGMVASLSETSSAFGGHGVRGASTANVTPATFTVAGVDGLTYVAGERILLKNQTAPAENGIYVVGTVAVGVAPLTRALDADGADEIVSGMLVHVSEGTVALDAWFFLATNAPITVGTTSLSFTKVPNLADLAGTAGAGTIGILDTAAIITATNVETALAELAAIVSPGGVTKIQVVTGTFVAGLATITVGAGQAITANTRAFPAMQAIVTGSTNLGGITHMQANNMVGGNGVGQVLFRLLGADGETDVDAAGAFAAILIN